MTFQRLSKNRYKITKLQQTPWKAIASRLKTVLPILISNDQTGFMKGRFIGENIRLIDGIATQHNVPGLLLFIDFEKAFDSLEWPFIFDTFRFFGFGPSLINWVGTFYCNIESCVLNMQNMAGQATSSSLKEEFGKAVPFPHICLFLLQRSWPRPSITIRA